MGVIIKGTDDTVKAADGSLSIEGFSINTTGIGTFDGGVKVGSAVTIHSNGNLGLTGIITATNFKTGDSNVHNTGYNVGTGVTLDGNTGNAALAGIVTANNGIKVGAAVTVDANTGNVAITGIITASSFSGVTEVGGASGVDFNDSVKARWGTGNDLELYHDGSNSYIDETGTGSLLLRASPSIEFRKAGGTEKMLYAEPDAQVELYYDNTKVVQTASQGIDFATDGHGISFSGQTASSATGVSGTDVGQRFQDYEMGDWTPTDGTGTALTGDTGRYFKHGHLVYAAADCTFGNRSGSGTLTVDGLPYTIGSNAIGGGYLKYSDITSGQFTTYPLIHINPGTTALHFPGTTISNTSQKRIDFVVIYVVYNF